MALPLLSGCRLFSEKAPTDYQTVEASPNRDTARAEGLHAKALKILKRCETPCGCECIDRLTCKPCKAEQLLQDALIADVRYGPAHNTLGTLYLKQRKLYLAAWEFEYASRLMPQRPEPLNNLGLLSEEAGRYDVALESYQEALSIAPTNPECLGNFARVSLKQGAPLDEVRGALQDLLLYDTRPEWIAWARELLGTHPLPRGMIDGPAFSADSVDSPMITEAEQLPAPELIDANPEQPGPQLVEPSDLSETRKPRSAPELFPVID